MTSWNEFVEAAPRIGGVFRRRHAAASSLCLLGTLRSDGYPRISPVEPRFLDDQLWLVGMPNTTKFNDLCRDPRFCCTQPPSTPQVTDGDAKLWEVVTDVRDEALQQRYADELFEPTGFDIRGQEFDHFYRADLTGGSAVEVSEGHLAVTIWNPGELERVVRQH